VRRWDDDAEGIEWQQRRHVRHLAFSAEGGTTACGLKAVQHRPVQWTTDRHEARVSCLHCRRWLSNRGWLLR
jgi:hypothetical protein